MTLPRFVSVLLLALLLAPAGLAAHAVLVGSTPAAEEVLANPPRAIRLELSEPVNLQFTRVRMTGADGSIGLAAPVMADGSGAVIEIPINESLPAGIYRVEWQVAGDDGHPVRGAYQFELRGRAASADGVEQAVPGGTAEEEPREVRAPPPVEPGFAAESPAYVVIRWVNLTALIGLIGIVAFRVLILRLGRFGGESPSHFPTLAESTLLRASWMLAGISAAALVLRMGAHLLSLFPASEALSQSSISAVLGTNWGTGWMLQLLGLVVVAAGIAAARSRAIVGWTGISFGILALAFALPLSGHAAAAESLTILRITADGLHVLGAGGWLGSLAILLTVGLPAALKAAPGTRGHLVARLVAAFSPTALFFAALVVLTGGFAAWQELGTAAALWESTYGRVLLLKLGLLSVVFLTGAYNWIRVKPRLGSDAAIYPLRRSGFVEVGMGIAVLFVTAILVATSTPVRAGKAADMLGVERHISFHTSR